jgi:hypothetical protein
MSQHNTLLRASQEQASNTFENSSTPRLPEPNSLDQREEVQSNLPTTHVDRAPTPQAASHSEGITGDEHSISVVSALSIPDTEPEQTSSTPQIRSSLRKKKLLPLPQYKATNIKLGRKKGQVNQRECTRLLQLNKLPHPCQVCKKAKKQGKCIFRIVQICFHADTL